MTELTPHIGILVEYGVTQTSFEKDQVGRRHWFELPKARTLVPCTLDSPEVPATSIQDRNRLSVATPQIGPFATHSIITSRTAACSRQHAQVKEHDNMLFRLTIRLPQDNVPAKVLFDKMSPRVQTLSRRNSFRIAGSGTLNGQFILCALYVGAESHGPT